MAEGEFIDIEVVYALPQRQTLLALTVPAGTTVRQVLARTDVAEKFPDVDLDTVAVGIFGVRVAGATALHDHDRIEIYRPLMADPKQARRARARAAR